MTDKSRIPLQTLSNKYSKKDYSMKQTTLDTITHLYKTEEISVPYNLRKNNTPELAASKEYILSLKGALREVIEENELVSL